MKSSIDGNKKAAAKPGGFAAALSSFARCQRKSAKNGKLIIGMKKG